MITTLDLPLEINGFKKAIFNFLNSDNVKNDYRVAIDLPNTYKDIVKQFLKDNNQVNPDGTVMKYATVFSYVYGNKKILFQVSETYTQIRVKIFGSFEQNISRKYTYKEKNKNLHSNRK